MVWSVDHRFLSRTGRKYKLRRGVLLHHISIRILKHHYTLFILMRLSTIVLPMMKRFDPQENGRHVTVKQRSLTTFLPSLLRCTTSPEEPGQSSEKTLSLLPAILLVLTDLYFTGLLFGFRCSGYFLLDIFCDIRGLIVSLGFRPGVWRPGVGFIGVIVVLCAVDVGLFDDSCGWRAVGGGTWCKISNSRGPGRYK